MTKGITAFQKIVDKHILKVLPDGRMVLRLDWVWGHEITTPNAILDAKNRGCDVVFNPNKIKTMIDHVNPAKDTASAIQGKIVRDWSREHNIEFLDVGRNGVCHAVIPENGWILPGQIGIMGDSHTCTHGAFCSITAGVGTTELENGIITGIWICPPQKVIRVNFNGKMPANVFAKDLILSLISKIGVKGATNAVLEFSGSAIESMSMEARMTISNMAVEAGATSGIMMVDDHTINYLRPVLEKLHGKAKVEKAIAELKSFSSDSDAGYDSVIDIDVTKMKPLITDNYSPEDVKNVSDMAGKPFDQAYIGSCTNGRIEDLRIAAQIFRQTKGKVVKGVRCIIIPATQRVFQMAIEEGLIETFSNAGCFINGPTCGACLGMSCGVLAPGEVCISTTNRNFPGRMGKDGMVHLSSPATTALSAIEGKITEPSVELCKRVLDDIKKFRKPATQAHPTDWKEVSFTKPDYSTLLAKLGKGKEIDFSGRVFYLPADNVDTDQIIPAKYLTETRKEEFGKHCLEDAPISAADRPKIFQSKVLVTKENFGCGSSREHAPWALEGAGIKCVIASSFARIFETNMFANGLLCVTLSKEIISQLFAEKPENLSIDWQKSTVKWADREITFALSEYQKDLIKNNGAVGVMIKIALECEEKLIHA